MSNLYYNPKDFGFELVKDHDAAGSYEFDIVAIWRRGDEYFVAHDSGCSCPTPFEDTKVPDLKPVKTLGEVDKFARESWKWRSYSSDDESSECDRAVAALMDGLRLGGAA